MACKIVCNQIERVSATVRNMRLGVSFWIG
jgi:hypothetical protein